MATDKMKALDFFANLNNDMALKEEADSTNDRFLRMIEASERRTAELAEAGARRRATLEQNKNSLVGRLDLNEEGLAAQAVNLGASAWTGAGRVAGHILSAPSSLAAAAETSNLSQADFDAYDAYTKGKATPEQLEQLNRDAGGQFTLGNITRALQGNFDNATPLERIQTADSMRGAARSINESFDWSSTVNQSRRADLSDDLRAGFDENWEKVQQGSLGNVASGIAGLLANAGKAAVNNPGAVAEYVAENIPQLGLGFFGAAGKAGLAASNIGYAADNFQKGIEKYQKENNGAYPDTETREKMAMWAASTALAEQVGDLSLIRGIGGAASDAADIGRRTLLDAAKQGAKGVATEAATEGFQTYAEGQAGLDPATPYDIYEGSVIGGLSGGAMQGGGAAVAVAAQKVSEAADTASEQRAERAAKKAKFDKAVEEGDHTVFSTPGDNYAPDEAIRVLHKISTPETQEENYSKAVEVAVAADEALNKLQDQIKAAPEEEAKALMPQARKLEAQVESAMKLLDQFTDTTTAEEVAEATTQEAATKTINLAMTAPDKVDSATVKVLVEDTSNALTEDQRTYLRAFDEARVAENAAKDLDKVNTEVLYGSDKNTGIKQYRERVNRALLADKPQAATAVIKSLESFTKGHEAKAAAMQQAFDVATSTGETVSLARNKAGQWEVQSDQLTEAQRRKVGGINIHSRSKSFVDAAQYEARAARTAVTELQAAVAAVKSSPNVSSAPTAKAVVAPSEAPTAVATPTPASAPATQAPVAPARVSIKDKAAQGLDYLNNPPADFSIAEAKKIGAWASKQVERIEKEQSAVDAEDFDRQDELSDLKSDMKALVARSTELVKSEQERIAHEEENVEPEGKETAVESQPDVMMVQNVDATQAQGASTSSDTKLSPEEVRKQGFKKVNQVKQFFTKSSPKKTDTSSKVLDTPDALTKLKAAELVASDFLPEGTELNERQSEAIASFQSQATKWMDSIKANLSLGNNPDYKFRDPIQFLVEPDAEGKADAEENVKTAIAFAAFSWIAENASMPRFHTLEDAKEMFGVDEYSKISRDLYSAVRTAGTNEKVVMNSLGQRAVAALGLRANNDAYLNAQATLEASIGAHALKLLEDSGLVTRTTVPGSIIKAGLPADMAKETNANANQSFISPARGDDGKVTEAVKAISDSQKGTGSVLTKMFGSESENKEPSNVPITTVQSTTKNTDQEVPESLKKIIRHENSVPSFLRQDTWGLATKLSDDALLAMAGYDSTSQEDQHISNRDSVEAKNDGLVRELANARDYFNTLDEDTPMYFEHSVWKQQRVGIATNLINPQTSKIHRFMMYRPEWTTEVKFSDSEMMDNFRLRVAEGLGVKADKQSNENSLADFDKVTNDPTIKAGVQAIYATIFLGSDMTPEFEQSIVQAVKAGGENMHSLDALIALAHEFDALVSGKDSFTVNMMGEIDGVTNGPMLSHLLMGAATSSDELYKTINRGGFFSVNDENKNYNLWRAAPGNQDLYETTIGNVMELVRQFSVGNPSVKVALRALYTVTGKLEEGGKVLKDGRNIIKTPLTAMVFGSSMDGAIDSMFDKFLDTAYSKMEKLKTVGEAKQLIGAINELITFGGSNDHLTATSKEALLNHSFTKAQEEALRKAFNLTLGDAVKESMNTDFAIFMEGRKQYNSAAQAAYQLYEAARSALTEQFMTELMDAGEIDFTTSKTGVRTPNHDLNREQQQELKQRLKPVEPILNTLFSQQDGNLNAGLAISKSSRKLSTKSQYQTETQYGSPTVDGFKSRKNAGYERSLAAPGVAMLPMATHSTDSAISHNAVMGNGGTATQVLNVHDAHGSGLKHFQRTAQNLNKATFDAMLEYSPATQMKESLDRALVGMAQLMEDPVTAALVAPKVKAALADIAKKLPKEDRADPLNAVVEGIVRLSSSADQIKFQTLSTMGSVDQYALEGGQYEVTDADRQKAKDLLEGIQYSPSTSSVNAVKTIKDVLSGAKAGTVEPDLEFQNEPIPTPAESLAKRVSPVVASVIGSKVEVSNAMASGKPVKEAVQAVEEGEKAKVVQATTEAAKALKTAFSPWGEIGTSTTVQDDFLVQAFEEMPTMNKAQVMGTLHAAMVRQQAPKNIKEFNAKLFTVLNKLVPADITVKYVTPDTDASEIMEKGATNARGWYVAQNSKAEIYILSKEHLHSAINPEVLLHELTHSVLAGIVEDVASQPTEVQELVADLNNLMLKAKDLVEKDGLTQFAPAVENIHEFIAYGMTNLDFQKQVVSKTSMQSKTKKNELVQGMKAFIQNIVGILFRGSERSRQAIAVNGMTILIGNVSGLFNAVAKYPSKADILLNAVSIDPVGLANKLGTEAIFEAIKSPNPDNQNSLAFEYQMSKVMSDVVDKLHGPFGTLKAEVMANQAMTPTDTYMKAINTGKLPFASKAIAAGFKVNVQEAFVMDQVKAVVQSIVDNNETQTTLAHRELRKVFLEARQKIKPMDLLADGLTVATASQADKDAAQALWDFAFKAENRPDGTSDYVSNFTAAAMGHEMFASKLQFNTKSIEGNDGTLWSRIEEAFNKIMDYFGGLMLKTRAGDKANERINSLLNSLVDIEAKRRAQIAQGQNSTIAKFEEITKDMSEKGRKAVSDFGNSKFFKNSKNGYIKFSGTALNLVAAPERVEAMMEKMQEMSDKSFRDRQGIIASLVTEMQGITDEKAVIGKLLLGTKNIERARKEVITNTAKFVKQSFGKAKLTAAQNKAVTNTFLRTDMSALIDDYSMADIDKLLMNQKFRRDAIDVLSSKLASDPNVKFYANGIKGLAYYMATGLVRVPHLLMNAHNIARLGGYNTQAVTEEHASSVETTIDKLISLYALDYLSQAERAEAAQVLRDQNTRVDGGNGIEMILKLHKQMQADSKAHLFEGNDALFMKGYTSEIYNPYIDIVTADDEQGHELMLAGYEQGAALAQDNLDPSALKSMYVVRDGGLASHITGTLSLTNLKARGSKVRGDTLAQKTQLKAAKLREMVQMNQNWIEPDQVKKNYMAPVLNNRGEVSDYRYMMSKATKDTILERDNRFDKILGAYAGSVMDKQVSPVQNRAVVQALYDQYMADKIEHGDRFLEISAKSSDPVLREHWDLLPDATKKAVKEIWGSEKMYVRPDMLDINFGYRKYTLANIFKKDADELNALEEVSKFALESIVRGVGATKGLRGADLDAYVGRTGLYTRRAEDIWQEIVKEAKDIIVVRSGIVLLGNISSNLTELAWMGVPMKDIVRHHRVALRAASDYQRDSERLMQIETMLNTGYIEGSVGELEQEAVHLRDAINRNPVKELIDAGLMPTIVEDLAQDDDIYSYKSRFARSTKGLTDKLNDSVKSAAKVAYISHDTALYKGLNRATQLSDFVARYTLYHHVTTRADNPLSKEEAVRYASDAFVNYDIPTHRSLQYLNDMGLVMFTKYYIRIQKVLMRMFRENPARAMMMMAFSHYFSQVPTVLDGSLLNKLSYNPFSSGAFKLPGVIDDLATVKVGMSPFN